MSTTSINRDLREQTNNEHLAYVGAGQFLGLQRSWERLSLVKRFPIPK